MKRRNPRKRLLVSPVQSRLIGVNLGYLVFFVAGLFFLAWVPLRDGLQDVDLSLEERHVFARQVLFFHARVLPFSLATALLFALHTLLLSHRILGPLVAFRRAFATLGAGHFRTPLRIRRRDYLQEDLAALEAMRIELGFRLRQLRTASRRCEQAHARVLGALAAGHPPAEADLRAVSAAEERSRECWAAFELDEDAEPTHPEPRAALPTDHATPRKAAVGDGGAPDA